uniref:Uncharacterized protein n=1 Tax=Vitrella brassicaformis TaxID=1169539 RepID=A0A7S1KF51_9ALVE
MLHPPSMWSYTEAHPFRMPPVGKPLGCCYTEISMKKGKEDPPVGIDDRKQARVCVAGWMVGGFLSICINASICGAREGEREDRLTGDCVEIDLAYGACDTAMPCACVAGWTDL